MYRYLGFTVITWNGNQWSETHRTSLNSSSVLTTDSESLKYEFLSPLHRFTCKIHKHIQHILIDGSQESHHVRWLIVEKNVQKSSHVMGGYVHCMSSMNCLHTLHLDLKHLLWRSGLKGWLVLWLECPLSNQKVGSSNPTGGSSINEKFNKCVSYFNHNVWAHITH